MELQREQMRARLEALDEERGMLVSYVRPRWPSLPHLGEIAPLYAFFSIVGFVLIAAAALMYSYPLWAAVFVLGAIFMVLVSAIWKSGGRTAVFRFAARHTIFRH